MKKVFLFLSAAALMLSACNNSATIVGEITWDDSQYFDLSAGKWYAAIGEGAELVNLRSLSYTNYQAVTPVTTTSVTFELETKNYDNYTIIVFNDANENGVFDSEDINYSGNIAMAEKGEEVSTTITVMY